MKKPLPIDGPSMAVKVAKDKTVCQVYKKTNKSGIPIMKPYDDRKVAILLKDTELDVSTTARVTWKDAGDGIIITDGGKEHYLITNCPSNEEVIGLFLKKEDVAPLEEPENGTESKAAPEAEPAEEELQMLVVDRPYFKLPRLADDFKTGASLLWTRWVNGRPNPWRIAYNLKLDEGESLLPDGARVKAGRRKSAAARKDDTGDGWAYQITSDNALRRVKTERVEEPVPLNPNKVRQVAAKLRRKRRQLLDRAGEIKRWKNSGLTPQLIDQQIERLIKPEVETELKASQKFRRVKRTYTQWLRWYHEATVVEVAEMVDGTNVITFETATPADGPGEATIGVMKRSINNYVGAGENKVFVGYLPEDRPPNLERMLDWGRIGE